MNLSNPLLCALLSPVLEIVNQEDTYFGPRISVWLIQGMCFVAQRDLFSRACLCAEYPATSNRSAFTSKSRSYRCWLFVQSPSPQTIADASTLSLSLSLSTFNDLPTSPGSSSACLYARACKFLLAETHGIGEDCESYIYFAKHFVLRTSAILPCSVVVCRAHNADSGWYAKGSDVAPRGLSSLHLGYG